MSSILRTIKLLKSINQYNRSLRLHRNVLNVLKAPIPRLTNYRCLATPNIAEISVEENVEGGSHSLDKIIYRLDNDVRRMGRIYQKDVDEAFNLMKRLGTASSIQGLFLLRCCGSILAEEHKEKRAEIAQEVWSTVRKIGCPVDVSHYNALLKVYLENEYKFSPTDFLAEMEKEGIVPNTVTYQRLIARYCQDGDIEGSSKILEFMKSKGFAINETIFNSLVMGYTRANDMDNAKGIFELMRNAHLEPSVDTYTILACGYAEKGDIEGVLETLEDAEKNECLLLDRNYLEIITALAVNGHADHVDKIIPKIRKLVGYNHDCVNTILELVNRGQEDVAYKIFCTMNQPTFNAHQSGFFFMKQLIRNERPVEKVIDFCKQLKEKGISEAGLVKATEASLILQKIDHALTLINEMKKEGFPIRCHYFWPILVYYKKNNSEDGIYRTLQTMADMDCPANYETLTDYALPGVNTLDEQIVVDKLKETGMPLSSIISPLIHYYLLQQDMERVKNLVEKYPARLNVSLCRALAGTFKAAGDVKSTLEILKYIEKNPERSIDQVYRPDINGHFLIDYLLLADNNIAGLEALLQGMSTMDMTISQQTNDFIQNRIKDDIPQTVSELLEQITSSLYEDVATDDPNLPHPRAMNLEELENHLIELRSKGLNTRGVLRRLFAMYTRNKNLERVMEIKEEFDKLNYSYTGAMYAQMIDILSYHGKLDDALHYFSVLKEKEPDFPLDSHKVLNLAALLIKNDKYDDAAKIIEDHYNKFGTTEKKGNLQRNVWLLLNAIAEKGNIEMTKKFFDLLVTKYEYSKASNLLLGPFVKVHLVRDDIAAAFDEFERCANVYRCTPLKNDLIGKLIAASDEERLQKVMDHSFAIHGELNALFDLGSVCVELGNFRQAKKVFETPGIRAHHKKLDHICERYVQLDKVKELEQFIAVTKDIFDVNRDKMYYHLIQAYAKQNDVEKALGVWTKMQEEDVQPTARTLTYLAEYLKKNGHPVPFVVPKEVDISIEKDQLLQCMKEEDADQALQIKRNLESQGENLNVTMTSDLIEVLVRKDRLKEANNLTQELLSRKLYPQVRIIKYLLSRLAAAGDVETISTMENLLPPAVLRNVSFQSLLCNAYTNSNRHHQFLEQLEQNISDSKLNFPQGGILTMLKKFPETEERVLNLAERYYKEEGFTIPLNMVWIHYFVEKNYEKADALYKSCPEMNEHLYFGSIMTTAKQSLDETMARKLADILKASNTTNRSKGAAFSCLMDVLVNSGKSDKALAVLKEGQSCNLELTDFQRFSLVRLEKTLQSEGKPVPFEVPSQLPRRGTAQSSDSSESSDDDVAQNVH